MRNGDSARHANDRPEGALNSSGLNDVLARLGLGTNDLAALCGVSRITVWKWRQGILPVPKYAATILRQQTYIRRLVGAVH